MNKDERILVVGKISEIVANINDALGEHFDMQICGMHLDNLADMYKVLHPVMLIVCTIGISNLNTSIFEWINNNTGKMPILVISTKHDFDVLIRICTDERFIYCQPPIENSKIYETCLNALHPEGFEEEDTKEETIEDNNNESATSVNSLEDEKALAENHTPIQKQKDHIAESVMESLDIKGVPTSANNSVSQSVGGQIIVEHINTATVNAPTSNANTHNIDIKKKLAEAKEKIELQQKEQQITKMLNDENLDIPDEMKELIQNAPMKNVKTGRVPGVYVKEGDETEEDIEEEETKSGPKKILAIDDSPVVLRNLKLLLKDEYEVILATDGEMGIKRALDENPDIIILDYEMPGLNGNETFRALAEYEETILTPVIFLTGVHDQARVKEVLDLKPAGYVLKPIDSDVIHKMLKKIIKDWNL